MTPRKRDTKKVDNPEHPLDDNIKKMDNIYSVTGILYAVTHIIYFTGGI